MFVRVEESFHNILKDNDGSDLETFHEVDWGLMICLWSGPTGSNCWISFAPAFQCWSCC